jgi:hypothetical protein
MSFYSKSFLVFSLLSLSFQANALTVQHTNTVFANRGQCVATIFLRSQQEIKQLDMSITVQDATGKKLGTHSIEVEEIGASHATDSRDEFLEGEYICQDKFSLVVTRVVGIMDNQTIDLLQNKLVEVADFKPMPIHIKAKSESNVQSVPVPNTKDMFGELMSLIKSGKRTVSEYRTYLKKYDFDHSTEDGLPGFSVSGIDIFNDSPSPEDIIRLYFDEDQQLVAIFSFSGLNSANSEVFVEQANIANGKLLFLVKKHPMAQQLKRYVKEVMSNAG